MSEKKIRILDPLVADQIAAGEVVERPASVVKELVENSIDARATRVQVEIDGGGVNRIRVLDNGTGISSDEAAAAFGRHATSKISRLEDLDGVGTFGFRGEALPSIASVSKITLQTRTADSVAGTRIVMVGGELSETRETGCPVGTDFEVADLFFNTPARLKFLKKTSTEASHCAEAVVRLALIAPHVSFAFLSQGRRTRDLPRVERPHERVSSLFPSENLAVSEISVDGIHVMAILGPPQTAKAGAGSLYTYVNGRFVRDRSLLGAVTRGFAGTLEHGRYPVGYVSLTLPPGSFDVNVHPQKTEVRFVDQSAVYRAVGRCVGEMTARSVWTMGSGGVAEQSEDYTEPHREHLVPPPNRPLVARPLPFQSSRPVSPSRVGGPVPLSPSASDASDEQTPGDAGSFSSLNYIGQARGTFLIFDDDHDLVLLDQHAAHERVTYERLRQQLESGRISSQRLLIPHPVDLGPAEAERIALLEKRLSDLGLEISRSGHDRITVHSVPAQLAGASPDRLLADMVLALEHGRDRSGGDTDDHVLATMACHTSIRAGRAVNAQEVKALLSEMDTIDFAGHCPHGRPVLARIPWSEIRRRVGRQ